MALHLRGEQDDAASRSRQDVQRVGDQMRHANGFATHREFATHAARAQASWSRRARAALCAAAAVTLLAAVDAAAAAPVPCSAAGAGKYNCQFYVPGDGRSTGAPVQTSDGSTIGYLHKGTNWVVCQRIGGRVTYGAYFNNNWAWTLADNLKWGWVNAVFAQGGDNDGPFGGVPDCGTKHGTPPSAAPPPTTDRLPKDEGTEPDTSCSKTMGGQRATARFRGHVHGQYITTYSKGEKPRLDRQRRVDDRFQIGAVTLEATTCKRKDRWMILPPTMTVAKVESVGLKIDPTRKGEVAVSKLQGSKDKRLYGSGWGVTVKTYRFFDDTLVLQVLHCGPDHWARLAGILEVLGFPLIKVSTPVALGVWLLSKLVPAGGTDCLRLGEYDFRLQPSSQGLKMKLIAERGPRDGAALADPHWSDRDGKTYRREFRARIIPEPAR